MFLCNRNESFSQAKIPKRVSILIELKFMKQNYAIFTKENLSQTNTIITQNFLNILYKITILKYLFRTKDIYFQALSLDFGKHLFRSCDFSTAPTQDRR